MENLTGLWAIRPSTLELIIEAQKHGIKPAAAAQFATQQDGTTAIIPVYGVLDKYDSILLRMFGGTSLEDVSHAFKQAIANPAIKAIHFDIDSPGGSINGVSELSDLIFSNRGKKPITAAANGLMASAAYWIGSAADSITLSSATTIVGSIGVLSRHIDTSQREKAAGVLVTDITAGKYKAVTSQHKPLSDTGRETIQDQVDTIYSIFVEDVARNRGTSTDFVRAHMADGRIFIGQQALDHGLADSMQTNGAKIMKSDDHQKPIQSQTNGEKTMATDSQSVTEQTQQIWKTSAEIREEFCGNFETYLAYTKAESAGRIHITGGNVQRIQ